MLKRWLQDIATVLGIRRAPTPRADARTFDTQTSSWGNNVEWNDIAERRVQKLQAENTRLQRELNEALRALRKHTGMTNWDKVIVQRALSWCVRTTCEACEGLGEIRVDRWSAAEGVEPSRCKPCKGSGEIYTMNLHDPNGPPCISCPSLDCSDYELCARKKNPA